MATSGANMYKVPHVSMAFLTESFVVSFNLICHFFCQKIMVKTERMNINNVNNLST